MELVLHPSNQTIESIQSKFIFQPVLLHSLIFLTHSVGICQIVWPVGNANLAMIFATVDGVIARYKRSADLIQTTSPTSAIVLHWPMRL